LRKWDFKCVLGRPANIAKRHHSSRSICKTRSVDGRCYHNMFADDVERTHRSSPVRRIDTLLTCKLETVRVNHCNFRTFSKPRQTLQCVLKPRCIDRISGKQTLLSPFDHRYCCVEPTNRPDHSIYRRHPGSNDCITTTLGRCPEFLQDERSSGPSLLLTTPEQRAEIFKSWLSARDIGAILRMLLAVRWPGLSAHSIKTPRNLALG
jgi:hypothetical protein